MDASSQSLTGLITDRGKRFVIPVYQRPYSWDEEQCEQLWDDVLSIGRRGDGTHFTGSVVWVQDGIMSAGGVTPVMLIDGQQRITTLTLLLVALAEYARDHSDSDLGFSREEILDSYLINKHKKGDDYWKLTLSQGDLPALRAIVSSVECDDVKAPADEDSRLVQNLEFFKKRLASLEDPSSVWLGIQRLEIVSVSLAQGQDNPQLIFESMNSTGKGLSSADLIRNFVLMDQPQDEQEKLYKNHWRVIEVTLGHDSYDKVFDEFIRNWLTVLYAPEPLVKREIYPLFKRHVVDNAYNNEGRIVDLLKELERFALYYSRITGDLEHDKGLRDRFERISRLDATVANPLLLSFYDDYEQGAFGLDGFKELLDVTESYLFRRSVCDCASNGLNKFFPSIIARLNKVQDEGGDYVDAFKAFLLNEAGTNRRFPTDAEFKEALETRDAYHFRKCLYLLSRLENSYHPKDPRDFANGNYTIEHIMPQNALAHDSWHAMLGDDAEEKHERLVNTLGNLTLSAYNSELSDDSFEQKKKRFVGGYDNEYITISSELKNAEAWNEKSIRDRAETLADRALQVWEMPELPEETRQLYAPEKKDGEHRRAVKFKELVTAGMIKPGSKLTSVSSTYDMTAEVTDGGSIRLENGEEFTSPSLAAVRNVALKGGSGARNGWTFWKMEDGSPLDVVRQEYMKERYGEEADRFRTRLMYWDGFYDYCSSLPEFVEAFGDLSDRMPNKDSWAGFGIGTSSCHPDALIAVYEGRISIDLYCPDIEAYKKIHSNVSAVYEMIENPDVDIKVDDIDTPDKKTRSIIVSKNVDFDPKLWEDHYAWQAAWLMKMRAFALSSLK